MLLDHVDLLTDPLNNEKLDIKIFEQDWKHIIHGELFSTENSYPIVSWIPRLLIGELKKDLLQKKHVFFDLLKDRLSKRLRNEWSDAINDIENLDKFMRHQKKTSESFAFERNHIYKENNFEEQNFLHFLWWYIDKNDIKDKIVLDIWCGSGRFVKMSALFGARVAIGVDLSEAVDFAYSLTKDFPNIFIVQWDIYNLPFFHNIQTAYSIGVLHHLPNPKAGFLAIAQKVIAKWGDILIRVYARKNNFRALYLYEPIRYITRHMNKYTLMLLCHIPAMIVQIINYLTQLISLLWGKKIIKHIPFYYYINFPYNMKHNDAFDVLATPKSNYYYTADIDSWFQEAKLHNIRWKYLEEAGITFTWQYK